MIPLQQADFDMLLVNLRMDAIYVRENMHIRWVAEQGMVENIDVIVNQYKETRQLMVSGTKCSLGHSVDCCGVCRTGQRHLGDAIFVMHGFQWRW